MDYTQENNTRIYGPYWYNKLITNAGERKLLFILELQLISVEGLREIENHHLAKFTVIIVSGKNGQ